ncbi:MAG: prevent-host-death family protein [Gammaproteobacteria bacterium]|nr:prevent-host-death family protein [Gammaproteobacteria bacterium]
MQNLLTNKTASLTEFRNPKKVIKQAGSKPVAILNRDRLEGYFVPASAVEILSFESTETGEAAALFNSRRKHLDATLDYLKDK